MDAAIQVATGVLRRYGQDIGAVASRAGITVGGTAAIMGALGDQAFLDAPGVDGFTEGAVIAQVMAQNLSDLECFTRDVRAGLTYVGSAAQVIAGVYENADARSAQSVADVDFAFGAPGAGRPAGYRGEVLRFSEEAAQHPATTPPMALPGDTDPALRKYDIRGDLPPGGPLRIEQYQDGSARSTAIVDVQPGVPDGAERTTVTDGSGRVAARYERVGGTDSAGHPTTTTTTQDPAGDGGVTRTVTVQQPDGSLHITSVWTRGDGMSETTTLDEDRAVPPQVIPGAPR